MSEKGKKNKKKTGLGLALWILACLIILIVFLVKQEDIKNNFDKSGASALIEKKIGKEIFEKKDTPKTEEVGETLIDLKKKPKKEPVAQPKKEEVAKVEEKKTEVTLKQAEKTEEKQTQPAVQQNPAPVQTQKKAEPQKPAEVQKPVEPKKPAETQKTQPQPKTQAPAETKTAPSKQTQPARPTPAVENTMKTLVCFVSINSDGLVLRKEVGRTIAKDSPLLEAITALIKGPSASEARTGCTTCIPSGTRLLGVNIKDGIATLNFSDEFQFNPDGSQGANIQLMQVVYTATNFTSVKKVQILIEGQKRDYLTEGVWIGSPLNRNSF